MNVLDFLIVLLLVGSLIMGYRRGFIRQVIQLTGFLAAFVVAYMYFETLIPWVETIVPFPQFTENVYLETFIEIADVEKMFYSAISFGLLFLGVKIALSVVGFVLDSFMNLPVISSVNGTLGAALALVEVAFILIIAIHVFSVVPAEFAHQWMEGSYMVALVLEHTPFLTDALRQLWQENFGNTNVI